MQEVANSPMLTPKEIAGVFAQNGPLKVALPLPKLLLYGVLGGAYIALGGLLALQVSGGMPGIAASNPGLVKWIAGALFPLGLVLVVLAGGSLFTSDCAVLPFAWWQKQITAKQAFRVAALGYLANFAGALLVASCMGVLTGTLAADPWRSAAVHLATHKAHQSFLMVFVKGIGANGMVCLAVWMAYAAKDVAGKVLLMWMPVMAFVALGWEHSIANMFFIPLGMMLGAPVSIQEFLLGNLLPATLGNIAGGMLLVAWPYYQLYGNAYKKTIPKQEPLNHTEKNAAGSWSDRQDLHTHLN